MDKINVPTKLEAELLKACKTAFNIPESRVDDYRLQLAYTFIRSTLIRHQKNS